jgi:hypothetical protein
MLRIVEDGPVAADGVQIPVRSGGQQWLVSWHPPPEPPDVLRTVFMYAHGSSASARS